MIRQAWQRADERPVGEGVPEIAPSTPRTHVPRFWRVFFWWIFYRVGGWRFRGHFPDVPRLVIIVAPHSSGWDAVWGLAAKIGLDLGIVFMAKQELFKGPVGWLLSRFGGLPVDRAAPGGIAEQVGRQIRDSERMWFLLAPEGTRRRVDKWKTGYWKIARAAQAPVLLVAFDYPSRTIEIGPLLECSDDVDADMARVREWYRPFVGKHRSTV